MASPSCVVSATDCSFAGGCPFLHSGGRQEAAGTGGHGGVGGEGHPGHRGLNKAVIVMWMCK